MRHRSLRIPALTSAPRLEDSPCTQSPRGADLPTEAAEAVQLRVLRPYAQRMRIWTGIPAGRSDRTGVAADGRWPRFGRPRRGCCVSGAPTRHRAGLSVPSLTPRPPHSRRRGRRPCRRRPPVAEGGVAGSEPPAGATRGEHCGGLHRTRADPNGGPRTRAAPVSPLSLSARGPAGAAASGSWGRGPCRLVEEASVVDHVPGLGVDRRVAEQSRVAEAGGLGVGRAGQGDGGVGVDDRVAGRPPGGVTG